MQPVLAVVHVPPNPAEHAQRVWSVAPLVVDPVTQIVHVLDPFAALKLLAPHAVQPVLAVVHAPPNPAEHTQPVWPVAPSVVDPPAQVM
jgi:hypothetical protein